jgi:regulator of sigma E protease
MPEEPAAKAGIVINDEIVDVNGKPIEQWKQFTEVVAKSIDKPIKLTIKRDNQLKQMVLTPRAKENSEGEIVGFAGLVVKTTKMPDELMRQERFGPLAAFEASVEKTVEYTVISVKLIGKLIVGKIGLRTLSGPVSIAQGAGATVVIGFQYYLGFLAVISISLGVLNLLPIPILDGGHLLFFLIELITRKPVPERIQTYGFKIGLFLLIFLMTIAFYNDLVRLL